MASIISNLSLLKHALGINILTNFHENTFKCKTLDHNELIDTYISYKKYDDLNQHKLMNFYQGNVSNSKV